jgi:copper chaperone CopZ
MKAYVLSTLIFFVGLVSYAQNKNAKTVIEVDGVCGMCKVRIEKAALDTKGVKSAVWNQENHYLNLIFDERKTNVQQICENIAEAGHDTRMITATDEAYNSIHDCCKYRDEEVKAEHKKEKKKDS